MISLEGRMKIKSFEIYSNNLWVLSQKIVFATHRSRKGIISGKRKDLITKKLGEC